MAGPSPGANAVRGPSKPYATRDARLPALEGISFGVSEGDFVAVVGPSDGGKSTRWGIITPAVEAGDLITNELIDEVNRFAPSQVAAAAKASKPR